MLGKLLGVYVSVECDICKGTGKVNTKYIDIDNQIITGQLAESLILNNPFKPNGFMITACQICDKGTQQIIIPVQDFKKLFKAEQ